MSPVCTKVEIDAFADDAFVPGYRRPDQLRSQHEVRIVGELRSELFLGRIGAIAGSPGEPDFKMVSFWAYRLDLHRLARLLWLNHDRPRREVERHTEHVSVLDIEEVIVVEVVGLSTQCASNYLLTEKLRAEGSDAENVRHGVRIPALGEHGD